MFKLRRPCQVNKLNFIPKTKAVDINKELLIQQSARLQFSVCLLRHEDEELLPKLKILHVYVVLTPGPASTCCYGKFLLN